MRNHYRDPALSRSVFILLLMILYVSTLVSCSDDINSSYSVFIPMGRIGISEEGILYTADDVLWYHDFESGQKVVLCNKPDCLHQPYSWDTNPDPVCNAVLPNKDPFKGLGMYNGSVYILSQDKLNHTIVYKEKPDGYGRGILTEFDWSVDPFNEIIFKNNMAYLIAVQYIIDEQGTASSSDQKSVVLGIDLQTGKVNELTEVKYDNISSMGSLYATDDRLRYSYIYYDEGMDFMAENAIDKIPKYMNYSIFEVDLTTGNEKQVMDVMAHEDSYIGLDDKCIYFLSKDKSKIYSVSRDDSTKKVLFEGKNIRTSVFDNIIIFDQNNIYYGIKNYIDLSTSKTGEINRPENETMPTFFYDKWAILTARLEDGQYHTVCLTKEDYLNGKTDYIIP